MDNKKIRLQKYMAQHGVFSRRACENLIEEERVKVNGKLATLGDKVDPFKDSVSIDGKKVRYIDTKKYYIIINKPRGYITTMKDQKDRKCVADLIKGIPERLYPVGRLDKDSEGLILMTNDGEFANYISHPSTHIPKVYRVTVRSSVSEQQLVQFNIGMDLDGEKTKPCNVNVIFESKERSVLEIILFEGKNRQIRRMCEKVGLEVIRLKRTKIGQVKIGMLKTGKWRELTKQEVDLLMIFNKKAI